MEQEEMEGSQESHPNAQLGKGAHGDGWECQDDSCSKLVLQNQ